MKRVVCSAAAFLLCLPHVRAESALALFDTGTSSPDFLANQQNWTKIAHGQLPASFKGDAVLENGKVALVLRKGAAGARLYAGSGVQVELTPLAAGKPRLEGVKAVTNDGNTVCVEAAFGAATITFRVAAGQPIVKTESRGGATGLRVEAPCRLGILPDFFADDMVIDAQAIPLDRTDVPSENFFLHMCGRGEAMVIVAWDKSDRDVELTLAGKEDTRFIHASEVAYGKGSIWVAALVERRIWFPVEATEENAGKTVDLDCPIPFQAKWKADLSRPDHTVDSWEMMWHPKTRSLWATGVGRYTYPVWIDWGKDPKAKTPFGHIEVPKTSRGPIAIYPIDRDPKTPLDKLTVVDIMRNSLGVGPCEYILDVAGQTAGSKGVFTCEAYDRLVAIFNSGRQKDERALVEQTLKDVVVFVHAIRDRIMAYQKFGTETLEWLAEQKKAHPELEAFIAKMEELTRRIHARYERRKGATQTDVVKLTDELRPAITADASKVVCERVMERIRGVGEQQDDLVAECRMAVKLLRQSAALEVALNPKAAELARELRTRTHAMLRTKLTHEGR